MSYRWVVLATGTFAQLSYSAIWFGVAVMAPALHADYGFTLSAIGFLISASLFGSVFTLLPLGFATDLVGERLVLGLGLALSGGSLIAASSVRQYGVLWGLLFVAGLTGCGVQAASGRSVMEWFEARQLGLALGIRQTAIPLSGFLVGLALPGIIVAGGVRGGFLYLGLIPLLAAILGVVVLRRRPPQRPRRTRVGAENPLRNGSIWRLSIGSGVLLAPQYCIGAFTVVYLHERGLSVRAAAGVLAAMLLLAVAGRVGAGVWSDRVGSRIRPLRAIALAVAATVSLVAALSDAPLAATVPVLVVAGVLAMSWNGLSFAAALELAGPEWGGGAIGLQQTVLTFPGVVYPVLFAAVVGATSWGTGLGLLSLFPLAAYLILRRGRLGGSLGDSTPARTTSSRPDQATDRAFLVPGSGVDR